MEKFKEFRNLMEEYDALLDKLSKVENSKVQAISHDRIEELEALMRSEEAEILRMRGLDGRRKKLLDESGYSGMTFSQVVDSLEGEEHEISKALCMRMKEKTESLRGLSGSTANMIEAKLITIDELIARNNLTEGVGYGRDGTVAKGKNVSRIGSLSV